MLSAKTYQPPAPVKRHVEDKRRAAPAHIQLPSAYYRSQDDEPTPRALNVEASAKMLRGVSPAPSESVSECSASNQRDSVVSFDSLYDASSDDNDSEFIPIRISNSIKKNLDGKSTRTQSKGKRRVPSLIIPDSPSGWPSIHKLRAAQAAQAAAALKKTPLSPQALAHLAVQHARQVPAKSATPSLAESLTSDELASMSPSTPSTQHREDEDAWEVPLQLHPAAMDTLHYLNADDSQSDSDLEAAIELSEQQMGEMQDCGYNVNAMFQLKPSEAEEVPQSAIEPISAISIPSPGGFFASLTSPVKRVWTSAPQQQNPSTCTAEKFYNLPFSRSNEHVVAEQVVAQHYAAPAARQDTTSTDAIVDEMIIPTNRVYEYDDSYEVKLKNEATKAMTRTSLWLKNQNSYLSQLQTINPPELVASPDSIKTTWVSIPPPPPRNQSTQQATPRSVVPAQPTPLTANRMPAPAPKPQADPLFYHAFQHFLKTTPTATAFTQRHHRLDALNTQRKYLHAHHLRQLSSSYQLPNGIKPFSQDSIPNLPAQPNDHVLESKRIAVATADRERAATDQILLSMWNLQASRFLAQGKLLPSAADKALTSSSAPKVLDLAGNPTADWAWALAWESKNVSVTTAIFPSLDAASANFAQHKGPSNHRVVSATAPWRLPFADGEFDVVSARSLHVLLRTRSTAPFAQDSGATDEWALTLREIYRVLKTGGVLSYETLDAEVHALPAQNGTPAEPVPAPLAARSSAFLALLRTLRYDAQPSVSNLARLEAAGFRGAKEQVMLNLALAGRAGERAGVEALTGLVGSVGWERWMARVQREAGVSNGRVLDGVAAALEGAGKEEGGKWGWRVGRGWARK